MIDSTLPTETATQPAVIGAFYANDYAQVIRLCSEILSVEPTNAFAQSYLAKVEEALDEGYGVPLDLRRRFHQANRLAQLQQYAEARAIYEQIIDEARSQGIPRWGRVEAALLRMDSYEAALPLVAQAEACLAQDAWEEAIVFYHQALAVAPDLKSVATRLESVVLLVGKVQHLWSLVETPLILWRESVANFVEAIQEAHLLLVQWPASVRIQALITRIEEAMAALSARLHREIRECLELARQFDHPRVAAGLLRRARGLLAYPGALPTEDNPFEGLAAQVYALETQLTMSREVERQIFLSPSGVLLYPIDIDLTPSGNGATILAGIDGAMQRIMRTCEQAQTLNREIDIGRAALTCETIEAIVALPAGDVEAPSDNFLWWAPWQKARSIMAEISRTLSLWQTTRNSDVMRRVYTLLEQIHKLSDGLMYPLGIMLQKIYQRWAVTISRNTAAESPEFSVHFTESNQG